MVKHATPVKQTIRAFVRELPGLSAAKQEAAAAEAGNPVFYPFEQREAWLRSLGTGQTGWVWRLSLLAAKAGGEFRPSTDFTMLVAELTRRIQLGARLIEGETKVSSDDWPAMMKALCRAADQVSAGRRLSALQASKMGERGRAIMVANSAASVIKRPEIAAHLTAIKAIWRSAEYPHRDAAADAINSYLRERQLSPLGSAATLFRVFGGRGLRKDAKKPDRESWVYFIRLGTSKKVKIGKSFRVDRRMSSLKHPLLGKLTLLAKVPGGHHEEKAFHKRFAQYRINGEWFKLEGELAEFVAGLRKR